MPGSVSFPAVTFSFSIDDLKKSLPNVAHFDGLDGDELVNTLRTLLGAAAMDADVTVADGVVTVTPKELPAFRTDEAARLNGKAGARAKSGEFEKAVGIYRKVLELDPSRHDARRDLAMVLVEMGHADEAKDLLLDVLKTNPRDVASLVILGNHYAKAEGDRDSAEQFFRRAVDIDPDDATAHNSLAGMLCEKGQNEEALAEFEKALTLRPDFPQPRYGTAMVYLAQGRMQEARTALGEMFEKSDLGDSRNLPMLRQARDAYLKFTNIIANDSAAESAKVAEELVSRARELSGVDLAIERQPLPGIQLGRTQMAWKYRRDHHVVTLAKQMPAEMLFHHILAHECHHILLEAGARGVGANRWFTSTDDGLDAALDSMERDIRKISRTTSQDMDALKAMLRRMLPDALSLVYNAPLDILIERQIAREPRLTAAQFCSLSLQVHNASRVGLEKRSRTIVPPALLQINDVLNGSAALFLDKHSKGATNFFEPYQTMPTARLARDICAMCCEHDGPPGSEYALIDQIAELLGCRGWYSWRQDPREFEIVESFRGNAREGLSEPASLKQRSAAAVQLLIKTLDRYEGMAEEAVKRVVMEAAFAGEKGVKFTDPTPTHKLEALPGETLSGLEIMCLLYAGLRRISPEMPDAEIGMDLDEEYKAAIEIRSQE